MDAFSILIVSAVILFVTWILSRDRQEMPEGLPPGSMGLPFIGDSIEFVKKKVCVAAFILFYFFFFVLINNFAAEIIIIIYK